MRRAIIATGIGLLTGMSSLFAQISVKKGEGGLWIMEGQNKIAFYQKEEAGMNMESKRTNYLHPLYLPDGTVITENAPADHPHHRGIFWAWHQILVDGKSVGDSWTLEGIMTDVKDVEFKRAEQDNGILTTTALWRSSLWKNGNEALLKETTTYTFYPQNGNYRRIRIDIALNSLVDHLQLGGSDDEKGYGGFSVRMRLPDDITFTGENGKTEPQNTAVEAGNYMNMAGSVGRNGSHGGIFIYAHPQNQSSPQTWILRNKASMQNAVFPGRNPVELQKNVPLQLSYTLIAYNSEINIGKIIKDLENADGKP